MNGIMNFLRKWILFLFLFRLAWICSLVSACPRYQVPHKVDGKGICCKPVFNCATDHMVKFCTENGLNDTCEPCPSGQINKYITSSLDPDDERHVCFQQTKSHSLCPSDSFPIADTGFCSLGTMYCQCNTSLCYFGDPCMYCNKVVEVCGANNQLNPATGVCEPCQRFMMSPVGCGPCRFDEAAWRLSESRRTVTNSFDSPDSPIDVNNVMHEKSTVIDADGTDMVADSKVGSSESVTAPSENTEEHKNSLPLIIAIVLIVVVVIVATVVAVCLYTKRQATRGRSGRLVAVYKKFCMRENSPVAVTGDRGDSGGIHLAENGRAVASVRPTPHVEGAEGGEEPGEGMELLKSETQACSSHGDTGEKTPATQS